MTTTTTQKIRTTAGRMAHDKRPNRESLSKRLGRVARQIKARDEHRCVYCGSDGAGAHLHLDHLLPRANGGADVATNLVVACRRCNTARKTLSLAQWAAYAAEPPAAGDRMKITLTSPPTARLLELLRSCHDDSSTHKLVVTRYELTITRHDGSELSDAEAAHVRGYVAAHKISPL